MVDLLVDTSVNIWSGFQFGIQSNNQYVICLVICWSVGQFVFLLLI